MTEPDLVERCREGNREAQRELYDRTSENIYRLLLRMTASPDDAFDLAQETYLKAFTRMGQFDGRSSVATWLYRVAVNEALQFLRRARRTRVKLQQIVPAPAEGDKGTESDFEHSTIRLDMNDAVAALAPIRRGRRFSSFPAGVVLLEPGRRLPACRRRGRCHPRCSS